ncbi:MAG: glycosyltransferase family A protein [Pseudomonadota bacterium]
MSERSKQESVGVVVIGRNEGARLTECLASLAGQADRIVYVDSGSTDDSVAAAQLAGAETVALDMSKPFTAARARNAGYASLVRNGGAPEFVQFVDGDCEIAPGWIKEGAEHLAADKDAAVVFGEIFEKAPEKTLYNRMIDREWRGNPGETEWCGGIAMMRARAFEQVGGFRNSLIAGEEPELCVRLREQGWKIWRHHQQMALHDADMRSLGQWLKRARRAGHAFAEVSALHLRSDKSIWKRETMRPIAWIGGIAIILGLGVAIDPAFWIFLALYLLQIARMASRDNPTTKDSFFYAALLFIQKPWEAAGVGQYWLNRLSGRNAKLIEYRAHDAGQRAP